MKRLALYLLTVLQIGAINSLKARGYLRFYTITGNTISAPITAGFCSGGNPGNIVGNIPSGGSGVYTYQWQTSTDSVNFTTVSGINTMNFDPPQISQTTWYRRLVTSDSDTATSISNTVVITISKPVTNNTITAPAVATFYTPAVPGTITGSIPSGDSTFTYRWQISTDDLNFTDLSGAAGKDLTALPLLSQTTYFKRIVTSGACTTPVISNTVKIIVAIPLTGNAIVAPIVTGFCSTGDPGVITGGTLSGGNGPYSYQWQSSADSIHFTSIPGADSINFDPPAITQTTWYRRLAFSGPQGAASANVEPNSLDFFLIGGQSNAYGTGVLSLQTPIPAGICWEYVKGAFIPVTKQAINIGNTGSIWAAFAVAYYNRTGRKVCLVPASVGATSQVAAIDDGHGNWDLTGSLVSDAVLLLNQGLAAAQNAGWTTRAKGILWDQGERDGNAITTGQTTIGLYQAALQNMIANFRTRISNNSLPFYIFRIANSSSGGLQVQAAQEAIAKTDPNTAVVFRDAIDYTVANGYLNPVGLVHYTQAGYNLAGQIGGDNVGGFTGPVVSNVIKINISNPVVPVLLDTLVQINGGNPAALAVGSPNNNTVYNWYDSLDATNLLFTGPTYVTPPLSANKTYYVQEINGACGISSLATAHVSIIDGLDSLKLSAGTLTPIFQTGKFSYNASVKNTVTSITLTPAISDSTATITVNGSPVATGTPSAGIPLIIGLNPVNISVSFADSSAAKTYTVIVTRNLSENADISGLKLSSGILSPAFAANTTSYTASVDYGVSSITLNPIAADSKATIMVNGSLVVTGGVSTIIPLSVGPNTVAVAVTAQDGMTTKTYFIVITRAGASVNAGLASLGLSAGTLTPVFATTKTSYVVSVVNGITSITVTPVISDTTATITINSTPVASGTASTAIPLAIGPNTINVTGTAQDRSTTLTYTITVYRAASSNSNLVALHLGSGSLSPAFTAATTTYTSTVANTVLSTTVIPAEADLNASITVNSVPVISSQASNPIALNVGPNTISVAVTAQDGTTVKTYTIVVNRLPSVNASLAGITLSNGVLSTVFSASKYSYSASVPYAVSSVTITPTVSDATATITVNGSPVQSGMPSSDIILSVGPNTVTTTVTAQDGITTKTYTLLITRAALSTVATLSVLRLGAAALSPAFTTATTGYTASVANSITSTTVIPVTTDANAIVTVNGAPVKSGIASAPVPLNTGPNNINVTITAQDGITVNTYTITITRLASVNANLAGITLSNGTLTPVFTATRFAYTNVVPYTVNAIAVTPTVADTTAAIAVNGTPVRSGTPTALMPLSVGANTVTLAVTAQDGITIKTYTIVVTRAAPSTNAGLAGLSISNGTLTPVFAAGSFSYTAVVAYAIGSLKITPTVSNATATVSVNGSPVQSGMPSSDIILSVGHNTVTTTVTAQDGVTTKTYAVVITRAAPSTNAGLSGLAISNGTLTPVFAPGRVAYTATVPYTVGSLTLAPTASDATATITVNGAAVLSGTASSGIGLSVGTNTITTTVMAQDGITTKTYAVVITRTAAATNAGLAGLALSVGTLAPVFATTKTSYVANVANSVNSIAFTPTLSDSNATVMVNNMQVKSGMLSSAVPLNAGANTINIVTLAQDRISTKTYAVTVNRAKSSNANLISLLLSSGALSPVFAATTMGYTANIANAVTAITLTPSAADTNATITVNNLFAKSGMASVPISLPVGTDTILIKTTAQNGTTSKTYTLIITRAMPSANSVYVSVSVATPTEGLLLPDLVSVHQAISPNGDGVNDFLMIDGIGAYPDNRLRIMNKNGEVIFEKYGYNNSAGIFDGHSNKNGTRQMSGTYFYEFEYKAAGIVKRKSGFLILKW